MANKSIPFEPTTIRWQPDFRYRKDKLIEVPLRNFRSSEDSITDKESYRVTLSSLRGTLSAQGMGSPTVGSYSIPAGQEYDPRVDFSLLNRPDVTIVQLDEYIEDFKARLQTADISLRERIESELAQAEAKKAELVKAQKETQNKD